MPRPLPALPFAFVLVAVEFRLGALSVHQAHAPVALSHGAVVERHLALPVGLPADEVANIHVRLAADRILAARRFGWHRWVLAGWLLLVVLVVKLLGS